MIDGWTLGIVLMALATYLARIGGYLVLGGRELSPRTMAVPDYGTGVRSDRRHGRSSCPDASLT